MEIKSEPQNGSDLFNQGDVVCPEGRSPASRTRLRLASKAPARLSIYRQYARIPL
jgi:hypothetical protein